MNGAEDNDENVATHLAGKKRSRSLKNVSSYGSMGFRGGPGKTSNDNESTTSEPRRDQSASLLNYYSEEIVRHPAATGETAQASYQNADEPARLLSTPDAIVKESCCKCKYIIEPMVFLQTLASSIVGIAYGQFVYNRILDRLIEESKNGTNFSTDYSLSNSKINPPLKPEAASFYASQFCNSSQTHNESFWYSPVSFFYNIFMTLTAYSMSPAFSFTFARHLFLLDLSSERNSTPSELRIKAQQEAAALFFKCGIFGGVPVILMVNLLGVNCSHLGRKFLIIINQIGYILRCLILLLQYIFPQLPDFFYFLAATIEGLTGATSVFTMAVNCYIADTTPLASRSYRLVLVNSISSISGLSVTYLCGFIIKYYGYLHLFISSLTLSILSFLYTIVFVPESLVELRNISILKRIKMCSMRNIVNCVKVYAPRGASPIKNERTNETDPLLEGDQSSGFRRSHRQSYVLMLIVFANFLYSFSASGLSSIFTLFIMNEPFCFDSVDISNYTLFAHIVTFFMTLTTSKLLKISDLSVCVLSVFSHFVNIFCFIFGNSPFYIYLAVVIGGISGLEYGYVRSIISKSFRKEETSDALALIISADTFINVVSSVLFPVLYVKLVAGSIKLIFYICDGVILFVLICHIVNWLLYDPIDHRPVKEAPSADSSATSGPGVNLRKNMSKSHEILTRRGIRPPPASSCHNLTTD